jgi:type-F conjugative transfer system pilin assembly protein TrbC
MEGMETSLLLPDFKVQETKQINKKLKQMKQMLKKTLFQILALMILATANSYSSFALPKQEIQIEPGIYVLVSFAINDESLRSYFNEANHYGAKLVMRGLVGKKFGRNRFAETKTKLEKVGINIDINPNLFKQFGIKQVPAVVVVNSDKTIKKISGHITLKKALEIMEVKVSGKKT